MNSKSVAHRLLVAVRLFIVLRLLELLLVVTIGELTVFLHDYVVERNTNTRLTVSDVRGAWEFWRIYCFFFGYIYFSAIAFLSAGLLGKLNTRRRLALVNAGAFAIHSLVVIGVVFAGSLALPLWLLWIELICFNFLAALAGWRWFPNED